MPIIIGENRGVKRALTLFLVTGYHRDDLPQEARTGRNGPRTCFSRGSISLIGIPHDSAYRARREAAIGGWWAWNQQLFSLPLVIELYHMVIILTNIFPATDAATDAAFD